MRHWLQRLGFEASHFWPIQLKHHFVIVLQSHQNTDLAALVKRLAVKYPIEIHWTHTPTYIELDFVGSQEELESFLRVIPRTISVGYHKD